MVQILCRNGKHNMYYVLHFALFSGCFLIEEVLFICVTINSVSIRTFYDIIVIKAPLMCLRQCNDTTSFSTSTTTDLQLLYILFLRLLNIDDGMYEAG